MNIQISSSLARGISTRAVSRQFSLGQTFATPGALAHLARHGVSALALLSRHARADWGLVCAQDREANNQALADGGRLLSAYDVAGERVWVITDAENDSGLRASTCILLPQEY